MNALTGAVLAAKNDSAILLVHHSVPLSVEQYLRKHDLMRLSIFGGEKAVDTEIERALKGLLP